MLSYADKLNIQIAYKELEIEKANTRVKASKTPKTETEKQAYIFWSELKEQFIIVVLCIGAFCGASYIEHHYTRENCTVVSAADGYITVEDLQGHLWQYLADMPIGSIVDLKMQDNLTPSDITDDIIKKVILRKVGIEEKTEEVQAVVFEEEIPPKTLKSIGTYTITAYCPCRKCCGKWANGITASGVYAKANHTIAAPKNIPFGTVLVIDGVPYTVEDRGGAIKGKKLDIYFDTHKEALKFGRQKKEVFIYED